MKTFKNLKNVLFALLALLIPATMILSACAPKKAAEAVIDQYNLGQTFYVNYDFKYNNCVMAQVFDNQSIEQTMQLTFSYNWTVLEQNKEYRAAKAQAENAPVPSNSMADDGTEVRNYNNMPAGSSPEDIYKNGMAFSLYVNSVVEAQVIPAPPEVTLKAMDAVQVLNNHKFQVCSELNQAAADYNEWRRQVTGRVVGDLAEYFNIEDMPKSLPGFKVEGFQNGTAPNTTNPYGPTAVPTPLQ